LPQWRNNTGKIYERKKHTVVFHPFIYLVCGTGEEEEELFFFVYVCMAIRVQLMQFAGEFAKKKLYVTDVLNLAPRESLRKTGLGEKMHFPRRVHNLFLHIFTYCPACIALQDSLMERDFIITHEANSHKFLISHPRCMQNNVPFARQRR